MAQAWSNLIRGIIDNSKSYIEQPKPTIQPWQNIMQGFINSGGEGEEPSPDVAVATPRVASSPFRKSTKSLPFQGQKNITTTFKDSLGRRVCMVNGERVDCPKTAEADDESTKETTPAEETPVGGASKAEEKPVPRRVTLNNIEAQNPNDTVIIWTDAGGRGEVASPDIWGKWARWISSMKDAPELVSFASEGWTDNPGEVLIDFTKIDSKSDEPDIDHVTKQVLEALQNQPDAHLAIVTISSEAPQQGKPATPPVAESPFPAK